MKCLRRTESIYSNSGNGGLYLFALNTDLFIMLDMLCASIMMLLSFHIDKKSAIFPEFSISEKKCQWIEFVYEFSKLDIQFSSDIFYADWLC